VFAMDLDPRWEMTAWGWVPEREPGIEAAFALVNGYLAPASPSRRAATPPTPRRS
jgi:hypothetical protein